MLLRYGPACLAALPLGFLLGAALSALIIGGATGLLAASGAIGAVVALCAAAGGIGLIASFDAVLGILVTAVRTFVHPPPRPLPAHAWCISPKPGGAS